MSLKTIEQVNQIISALSVSELRNPLNVERIMANLSGSDNARALIPHFMVEKGIKLYGGINEYITTFLRGFNLERLDDVGKQGSKVILNKMLTYEVSDENRGRLRDMLAQMGGSRKLKTRKFKKYVW